MYLFYVERWLYCINCLPFNGTTKILRKQRNENSNRFTPTPIITHIYSHDWHILLKISVYNPFISSVLSVFLGITKQPITNYSDPVFYFQFDYTLKKTHTSSDRHNCTIILAINKDESTGSDKKTNSSIQRRIISICKYGPLLFMYNSQTV